MVTRAEKKEQDELLIQFITKGYSVKQIAWLLNITTIATNLRIQRARKRYGAKNNAQLALMSMLARENELKNALKTTNDAIEEARQWFLRECPADPDSGEVVETIAREIFNKLCEAQANAEAVISRLPKQENNNEWHQAPRIDKQDCTDT